MTDSTAYRCRVLSGITLAAVLILNTLPIVLAESPTNTAIVPVPKLENDSYDWYARHEAKIGHATSPDLLHWKLPRQRDLRVARDVVCDLMQPTSGRYCPIIPEPAAP